MSSFIDLVFREKEFVDSMFETGDRNALKMYMHWKLITLGSSFKHYARMFGLCRLLGINNLYDIGCGNQYQAFMMMYGNMVYTGIDSSDDIDFSAMNQAFSNGFGERIKFVHGMYPFDISPLPNNAAIACGWAYLKENEESRENVARSLSGDFERIITDVSVAGDDYDQTFRFWESALPEFKVYKLGIDKVRTLGSRELIFATKIQKDIDIMKEIEYDYTDDRFMVGSGELEEILAKLNAK